VRLEGPGLIRQEVNDLRREFGEEISKVLKDSVPGVLARAIGRLFDSYRRSITHVEGDDASGDVLDHDGHRGSPPSWKYDQEGGLGLSWDRLQETVNDEIIAGIEPQDLTFDLESLDYGCQDKVRHWDLTSLVEL
jgi:hypothetical protein